MFINSDANPMVVRWKVALQQLDFQIKHIPGSTNVVADPFSRLCHNHMKDELESFPEEVILAAIFGSPDPDTIVAAVTTTAIPVDK